MWHPSLPYWEFVARAAAVYLFLLVLLRLTGKRQVGQLSPFDLVLLLVLSNAVQNSMNGGDNSLVGGMVLALTLVALNFLLGLATARSKTIENLVEGRPQVLIHNGQLFEDVLAGAQISRHELQAALRRAGCASIHEVRTAVLENNGGISVIKRDHATSTQGSTNTHDE